METETETETETKTEAETRRSQRRSDGGHYRMEATERQETEMVCSHDGGHAKQETGVRRLAGRSRSREGLDGMLRLDQGAQDQSVQ